MEQQLHIDVPPSPGRVAGPTSPTASTPRARRPPTSPLHSGDRFIPDRSAFDLAVSQFEIVRRADGENAKLDYNASPAKEEYKRELASTLYHGQAKTNRVLAFRRSSTSPRRSSGGAASSPATPSTSLRVLYALNKEAVNTPKRFTRRIPQMAERILDAPELIDDYYLNLLDW
jgi:cell division cycle protein 20 (cofactor of APC complex)